jgi:hypothetical protein
LKTASFAPFRTDFFAHQLKARTGLETVHGETADWG